MGRDVAARIEEHMAFLKKIARELVGHDEDADDIVQDALLVQLKQGPRDESKRNAWLAGVVRNLVRSRRRGDGNRREREHSYAESRPSEFAPSRHAEHQEQVDRISRALASLDSLKYQALYLRHFEGHMPREIAARLDIPVATVKRRIERALNQLRDELATNDADWRPGIALLAAAPAGKVGVKSGLQGLMIGTIAMKKIVIAAGALLLVVLASLKFASTPEDQLDVTVSSDNNGQALEPRRRQSDQNNKSQAGPVDADGATETAKSGGKAEGRRLLRLTLDGLTEDEARLTWVRVSGIDSLQEGLPSHYSDSWRCRALTSEFDLGPIFARVARSTTFSKRLGGLEIKICHPDYRLEKIEIPLSQAVEIDGDRVYVARTGLEPGVPHLFWPESKLEVLDANTREHLKDIELRFVPTAFMGLHQVPGGKPVFSTLGKGLNSPIGLLGGRETDSPEDQADGLAISPGKGLAPRLIEMVQSESTSRGIMVYVRAPGYAWNRVVLDVSKGADREVLLAPASTINIQFSNAQLEQYAELETKATLNVVRSDTEKGPSRATQQTLEESLVDEGLTLDNLLPGAYTVTVELGQWSWKKQIEIGRAAFTIKPGDSYDLDLALEDPPAPPTRTHIAGLFSVPTFGAEKSVRMQLYHANNRYGKPDAELSLADMESVGGTIPTWSFRIPNLRIGRYQVQIRPLMKRWIIEVPAEGRDDLKLEIPELAEVVVETVDAETGKRVPIQSLHYDYKEAVPGLLQKGWDTARREEPGRFRFWTPPGKASTWPRVPKGLNYNPQWLELQLVAGVQEKRFELKPKYAIRFEFRDGGSALPMDDQVGVYVSRDISAVNHKGRVIGDGMQTDMHVYLSDPGIYDISFKSVGGGRYQPIPTRRVEVRGGETTVVIVDLIRK